MGAELQIKLKARPTEEGNIGAYLVPYYKVLKQEKQVQNF